MIVVVHVSSGLLLCVELGVACFAVKGWRPVIIYIHVAVDIILIDGGEVACLTLVHFPVVQGVHVLVGCIPAVECTIACLAVCHGRLWSRQEVLSGFVTPLAQCESWLKNKSGVL